jgi:hypothetical protein
MFVTALVGLYTVEDLWNKFGDLRMSFVSRHGIAWSFVGPRSARGPARLDVTRC